MEGGKVRCSRLVVVSNRVPAAEESPGGLAVALKDALAGRESLWFGWSGDISETADDEVRRTKRGDTTFAVIDLTQAEYDGYYAGYANRALWPAFHYRLDIGVFEDSDYAAYQAVNERFARRLAALLRPDDLIWIHDYHLLLLAGELRRLGVQNPIGFFCHIPFPPPELFQAIPHHRELAAGLMAANVIGFQSRRDRANFERYIMEKAHGIWLPDGRLDAFGHLARAAAFPIAIDVDSFTEAAADPATADLTRRLKAASEHLAIILGVDRMDYSKGLPERLIAVQELFSRHPELRGRATLVQIAPVSRGDVKAYAELREQIETLVGHINGAFAQIDWAPVHYMATGVKREELASLLRLARVGLVTPLRDGMNLVAKEYVAAQDPENPGVLVLSEFAGAAEQLSSALIVNPHDTRQQTEAIHRALNMPLAERRERHAAMMQVLRECDSAWWSSAFLRELEKVRERASADGLRAALSLISPKPRPPGDDTELASA